MSEFSRGDDEVIIFDWTSGLYYTNNQRQGTWFKWLEDGRKDQELEYRDNVIVSVRELSHPADHSGPGRSEFLSGTNLT